MHNKKSGCNCSQINYSFFFFLGVSEQTISLSRTHRFLFHPFFDAKICPASAPEVAVLTQIPDICYANRSAPLRACGKKQPIIL